jgi:hypothetical protein
MENETAISDLTIEELESTKIVLTHDLNQNTVDLIECNQIISRSTDREVLERQRIIRIDLVENKTYLLNQLAEVKKTIKIRNVENNKSNNFGDLLKENTAKLDEVILLLKRINHKLKIKK